MFVPLRLYVIPVTGTASAGVQISEMLNTGALAGRTPVAKLYASGCDVVYIFSNDSTTLASVTPTNNAYPAGNDIVPDGAIMLEGGVNKYISAMSQDAASTGTLFAVVGYDGGVL